MWRYFNVSVWADSQISCATFYFNVTDDLSANHHRILWRGLDGKATEATDTRG